MAFSYSDFKTFLTTFLWRDGDAVLIANLDSLIKMADAELNRIFKVEDRTVTADAEVIDNILTTPLDYREMRNLSMAGVGSLTYASPLEFAREEALSSGHFKPIFTVSNNLIRLIGTFSGLTPVAATMVYYANLPDFKATGASWVADNYLDVYTYCALKHDRLMVWDGLYKAALQVALDENAQRKYTGSPQKITYGGVA
jgi:hypothetical protein